MQDISESKEENLVDPDEKGTREEATGRLLASILLCLLIDNQRRFGQFVEPQHHGLQDCSRHSQSPNTAQARPQKIRARSDNITHDTNNEPESNKRGRLQCATVLPVQNGDQAQCGDTEERRGSDGASR